MTSERAVRIGTRIMAAVLSLPVVAGGLYVAFLALWVWAGPCENCDASSGWHADDHAWQRTAQGVLGFAALGASLVTAGLLIAGRRTGAVVALTVQLAASFAWYAFVGGV